MKHAAALLLLAWPARAGVSEAVKLEGNGAFRAAAALFTPAAPRRRAPVLQEPLQPRPFSSRARRGKELARVALAAQLDRQRALFARQLGDKAWDIGGAADASMKTYYITFTPAGAPAPVMLAPLGDLERLRGAGVDARVDEKTVYNFKVKANILNPARGSTLQIRPAQGTRGPGHDLKTGAVLDIVEARAAVFSSGGKEFWLLYGTDVKADGGGFADTRSFLIIHEDGLSSTAWPLAETSLPLDSTGVVDLDGVNLALTRTSAGQLVVAEAR